MKSIAGLELDANIELKIVVIDNDGSAKAIADKYDDLNLHYVKTESNIGGSGGFELGAKLAVEDGAEWLWVMDDDVLVHPDAITKIEPFLEKYKCLIGRRYEADGSNYFFQPKFNDFLAVPLPILKNFFRDSNAYSTNCLSFEGAFFHRDVLEVCGYPDPRFFITWDDAIFGWVVSQRFKVLLVDAFVMTKQRQLKSISLGFRRLQQSSDLARHHMIVNRKYVREYFIKYGRYRPIGFMIGSFLVISKEIIRAILVDRSYRALVITLKAIWQ